MKKGLGESKMDESRKKFLDKQIGSKIGEAKKAELIKEVDELIKSWTATKIEFRTRIANINTDVERNFEGLIGDRDSRKLKIEKEINHVARRNQVFSGQIRGFIENTERLVTNYVEMDENRIAYIKDLNIYVESALQIIKISGTQIKNLERIKVDLHEELKVNLKKKMTQYYKEGKNVSMNIFRDIGNMRMLNDSTREMLKQTAKRMIEMEPRLKGTENGKSEQDSET